MDANRYFGPGGYFQRACELYRGREGKVPPAVLAHAANLGRSEIAYTLGWCFGKIVRASEERSIRDITQAELETIATWKITWGEPIEFINGFRSPNGPD